MSTYSIIDVVSMSDQYYQIIGTVDGNAVVIPVLTTALEALSGTTAIQNFLAPLMYAAANPTPVITPTPVPDPLAVTVMAAGTFTQ